MKHGKYDYKWKSNVCAICAGITKFVIPLPGISDALLIASAGYAAADIYWHPGENADIIESLFPMPYEEMTEEQMNDWRKHDEKTAKNDSKESSAKEES